jgi:hypothetical protein
MSEQANRDELNGAIASVLTNAFNYPEKMQVRMLGQNMKPLIERVRDAILAAGYRPAHEVAEAYDAGYAQAEADHYATGFYDVSRRTNPFVFPVPTERAHHD